MKKWLIVVLFSIMAQGSCIEETYYSYSEYKEYEHLVDSNFSSDNAVIINSNNIVMHINALGTYSNPNMVEPYDLSGQSSIIRINSNNKDPVYFSLSFNEEIYIDEFSFIVNAYHENQSLNKRVYINHSVEWIDDTVSFYGGDLIYEGDTTNKVELKPFKKAKNIMIVFDEINVGDIVELTSFVVDKYRANKHAYWTKGYIEGSDTYKMTSCLDSGKFNPNGTLKYEYDSFTKFSPSAKLISDYKPTFKVAHAAYDYGRGGYINPYASLDIIKNIDGYAKGIVGFKEAGLPNSINTSFYSYGNHGVEFPWIETANQGGVQYIAFPVHWSQYPSISKIIHISNDQNWCKHTTNSYATPCYKYLGHVSNTRLNSYDVSISLYDDVISPELQTVASADYYLYNELTKDKSFLKSSEVMDEEFHINKSGQYRILASLKDNYGNSNDIASAVFYIDQESPNIEYRPSYSEWTNKIIDVNIEVRDELSGVKSYDVQLNRGEYYHNKASITLDKEGVHYLKTIANDYVLNQSSIESGLYQLDFTKPVIDYVANVEYDNLSIELNIYDLLSKLDYWIYSLSYDEGLSYDSSSDKYTDELGLINLSLEVPLTMKIEAFDKAGNRQELIVRYEREDSKLEKLKLFSYRYQLNIENIAIINLTKKEQVKYLELYQDNHLIARHELPANKNDIEIEMPYTSDVENTTLGVLVYNSKYELEDTVELKIDKISEKELYGKDLITYSDIVASSISLSGEQIDYYEELLVKEIKDQSSYFQGQGIQVMGSIEYRNDCFSYTGHSCVASNDLVYGDNHLSIDNGASPIRDEYLVNNIYLVNMSNINNILMLDEVYVSKHEGLVYSSIPKVPYVMGGRKWYLDKNIDLAEHAFSIIGRQYGYNQVCFNVEGKYIVDGYLKEQYKIRFINPYEYNNEQLTEFLERLR